MSGWQPKDADGWGNWAAARLGAALLLGAAGGVLAADVTIEVSGLRNAAGTLYAAVCTQAEFLQPSCAHFGSAPASAGAIAIPGVPPGTYAVQVIHDENENGTLDRPGFLPSEGMGFSRDAPMRFGPPRWADAAFDLAEPGATLPLTMRYFQ